MPCLYRCVLLIGQVREILKDRRRGRRRGSKIIVIEELFWITGENLRTAIGIEDDHIIGILLKTGDIHARRPGRHSGNCDANGIGAFFQ